MQIMFVSFTVECLGNAIMAFSTIIIHTKLALSGSIVYGYCYFFLLLELKTIERSSAKIYEFTIATMYFHSLRQQKKMECNNIISACFSIFIIIMMLLVSGGELVIKKIAL